MDIVAEMAEIEASLSAAGLTVRALCAKADVNQSTWTRWKSGKNGPTMATWGKVRDAFSGILADRAPEQGAA